MKKASFKGKNVEEAKKTGLAVLKAEEKDVMVRVISEGRSGVLGIGGEEAEIEIVTKGGIEADSKIVLQEILDRTGLMAIADPAGMEEGVALLKIRGEDMGRIIGKEGATLKALEILVSTILSQAYQERVRVSIDAGDYKEKRNQSLRRLAESVIKEVEETNSEKAMPGLSAADRRIVHMYVKDKTTVESFSRGEGRDRQLVIAPKK